MRCSILAAMAVFALAAGGCRPVYHVANPTPNPDPAHAITFTNATGERLLVRVDRGFRDTSGTVRWVIMRDPMSLVPGGRINYHGGPAPRVGGEAGAYTGPPIYQFHITAVDVSWERPREARYELLADTPVTVRIQRDDESFRIRTNRGQAEPVPRQHWPDPGVWPVAP